MREIEMDTLEARFIWGGRICDVIADAVLTVDKEDVGPRGFREHVIIEVPQKCEVRNLSIMLDGNSVENPGDDLVNVAEDMICEKAGDVFEVV